MGVLIIIMMNNEIFYLIRRDGVHKCRCMSIKDGYITLQDVDEKSMFYGMSISEPKLYKNRFEAECDYALMLDDEE